jgi:hypothetical protein
MLVDALPRARDTVPLLIGGAIILGNLFVKSSNNTSYVR